MSIPGYATPEGTRDYLRKFKDKYAESRWRTLGRSDLQSSQIGFGSYRCHQDIAHHHDALKKALSEGCNLIDTSANYTDGAAEALIGEVLNEVIVWENQPRENFIVVSKAGYIQGENFDIASSREADGAPFPEVVKYGQGLWHCIHPEFLEDQITRSLARMHLDTLDIYLLHNPEYFLDEALRNPAANAADIQKEFYDRIRRAFIQLEKMVREGLIRHYGISSNGFPLAPAAPNHVSLASVWRAYQDACLQLGISTEQGHFAAIQLPYNWIEHQAFSIDNNLHNGNRQSVLNLAKALALGVLVNRPLNAIGDHEMLRLATYGAIDGEIDYAAALDAQLSKLHQQENALLEFIGAQQLDINFSDGKLSDLFQNVERLSQVSARYQDHSQAREILAGYFMPWIERGSAQLLQQVKPDQQQAAEKLLSNYREHFQAAAEAWLQDLNNSNFIKIAHLQKRFSDQHPDLATSLSFSQQALLMAAGTPGVDVVLNGMRTPDYVSDSLGILAISENPQTRDLISDF